MANTRIIADLRRHRGDSSFVIELVRRFASVYGAMTVDWVVRPDQANLLPPEHVIGQADSLDTSWSTRIRDCFVQMAQGDPGGSFWALSYDNAVLAPCEQLKLTHGLQISSKHLRELISNSSELLARPPTSALAPAAPRRFGPMAAGYAPRAIPPTFQPASTLSLAEGIELAKRVLLQGKHTSVESALRQTDLRPRMTFVDGRAAKQVGHFESEALISNIVDAGMQQGWLKRTRRTPGKTGTEVLYIVQAAPPAAGGAGPACQPAPPADQMEPPPLKAIPASDEVTAGGGAGPAASAIPEPPPVSAEANPQEARRKFPNRASVFEAELSKSRIGSMPETRELIFEALEGIFNNSDGPKSVLPELFAAASRQAQAKAASNGYTSERNWPIAEKCVQRLMLWAGVLMSDSGHAIADRIGCNSTGVSSLAPNFKRACEAYMAVHIISKAGGISYDDDPYDLGLTLYRRGGKKPVPPEELKAKVDELLAYLQAESRIYMDDDRRIHVRTSQSGTESVGLAVAAA